MSDKYKIFEFTQILHIFYIYFYIIHIFISIDNI